MLYHSGAGQKFVLVIFMIFKWSGGGILPCGEGKWKIFV